MNRRLQGRDGQDRHKVYQDATDVMAQRSRDGRDGRDGKDVLNGKVGKAIKVKTAINTLIQKQATSSLRITATGKRRQHQKALKGDKGERGEDGKTPEVTVTPGKDGHRTDITFTVPGKDPS